MKPPLAYVDGETVPMPTRSRAARLSALLVLLILNGCVDVRPVTIRTDPNREAQERMEEQTERDNVEAFIAAHPELDAETRRDLRDGTLSRSAALERLRRATPPPSPR